MEKDSTHHWKHKIQSTRIAAMLTHSYDYVEYCRETAKRIRNPHDLALRGANKEAITQQIQERIIQEVNLQRDDDVVDIGCGDGTLLRMAQEIGARSAVGLLATEEEVEIVCAWE